MTLSALTAYAACMRDVLLWALISGALLLAGCGARQRSYDPEVAWEEGEPGQVVQGMTISQVTGCSTGVVSALSQQLVDAVNCERPETLVEFSSDSVVTSSTVWPYLQPPARDSLLEAVGEQGGTIQVNSAFRTLVQQYLLYTWYQRGQCNISLAARPGRSNHESGLALDVQDHTTWRAGLESYGWLWLGSNDPVHFDFAGGGTVDLSDLSVLSFQRLWNRNNPEDLIDEDGAYGPQTESRIQQSPVEGFPLPLCAIDRAGGEQDGNGSAGDAPLELDLAAFCACASTRDVGVRPWWLAGMVALVFRRRK